MPAKSQAQQHLMGMSLAVKRGEMKLEDVPRNVRGTVTRLSSQMTEEQLSEFASRPKKSLPRRVSGSKSGRRGMRFKST